MRKTSVADIRVKYENPVSSPRSNCAVLLPQEEAAVRDLAGFPKLSG